jgi:hypothetical protein
MTAMRYAVTQAVQMPGFTVILMWSNEVRFWLIADSLIVALLDMPSHDGRHV